jgi:hypothetical protein
VGWWDTSDSADFREQVGAPLPLFASKIKSDDSLSAMIDDYLEKKDDLVPRVVTRKDGWHPSSLFDACRRFETLKRALPIANDRKQWPIDMKRRFQLGNAVHRQFQQELLSKMRVLKGTFECSRCARVVKNTLLPEDPCPDCRWQVTKPGKGRSVKRTQPSRKSTDCAVVCSWPGGFDTPGRDCAQCERGGHWVFNESSIYIEDWDIVGYYDGIVVMQAEERILEMKSIDTFAFNSLVEPHERDVFQANFYMLATGIHVANLCYVEKNGGLMKEFLVEFDEKVIDRAKRDITAVRKALEEGELPLGPCGSARERRAKSCPHKRACFTGIENIEELRNRLREEKTA